MDSGIRTWLFFISGFTQRNSQPHGVQRLWLRAHRLFASSETAVVLLPWHAPWREIAEQVLLCQGETPARVGVSAYSYGAGWGFVQLARQLGKRGIGVRQAVLCDAVYRSRFWTLTWQSLLPSPWITVPANVREVVCFRQSNSLPKGHQIVAADPKRTRVHQYINIPDVTHVNCDDYVPYHNKSLEMCAEVTR